MFMFPFSQKLNHRHLQIPLPPFQDCVQVSESVAVPSLREEVVGISFMEPKSVHLGVQWDNPFSICFFPTILEGTKNHPFTYCLPPQRLWETLKGCLSDNAAPCHHEAVPPWMLLQRHGAKGILRGLPPDVFPNWRNLWWREILNSDWSSVLWAHSGFRSTMSNRTFCDDGCVLYVYFPLQ